MQPPLNAPEPPPSPLSQPTIPFLIPPRLPAALPTLILFKGGKAVDRMEGVVGAADLRNRLEYFAAGQAASPQ